MSFVKIKSKIGKVMCIGTGKVVADKNGNGVTETINDFGNVYKVKTIGASTRIVRKDGIEMWKTQRLWLSANKENPLSAVFKNLSINDSVFIFGTLKSSKYIDNASGEERKSLFCNVEYIQVIGQAACEMQPICKEDKQQTEIDSDFDDDFLDF